MYVRSPLRSSFLLHRLAKEAGIYREEGVMAAASAARRRGLICAKVYVSEGRNQDLLDTLSAIAKEFSPSTCALVQRFSDPVYHRSNFTLGGLPGPVTETALLLIRAALQGVDLSRHVEATHPRVGAVDHVSIHPLGHTPIQTARDAALRIGKEVGEKLRVPVLYYGACNSKPLSEVRRGTAYFKGGMEVDPVIASDVGPREVDRRVGLMCCGAVPYVQNYNIRLDTRDRSVAAQVTKAVRSRDGGLEAVEALTLVHQGGMMEVACNLLDITRTTPQAVLQAATHKAKQLGVNIDEAYTIGFTGEEILAETARLLGMIVDEDGGQHSQEGGGGASSSPPSPPV